LEVPREPEQVDAKPPPVNEAEAAARIYFLPNLMTAGNLFCGYVAVLRCIQAKFTATVEGAGVTFVETIARSPKELYEQAIWFILAAVAFDTLDGRMARLTRRESLFGKEFDSLADVVSFGMAPSLLVFFFLLSPTEGMPLVSTIGGLIGFLYLLCAAVRLARFNVLTLPHWKDSPLKHHPGDFLGLPVPAAAGVIASLVLVLNRFDLSAFAVFLPILMLLISFLMVSRVPYPSLKAIGLRTSLRPRTFALLFVGAAGVFLFHYLAILILALGYVAFGLIRAIRQHGWKRLMEG